MMDWGGWPDECHYLPEQVSRLVSAQEKKMKKNIVEVNKKEQYMIILGSSGGEYETTLTGCTCVDFAMREAPCKHMYRLALELKLMEIPSPSKEPLDAEAEIERYKQLYKEGKVSGALYSKIAKELAKTLK